MAKFKIEMRCDIHGHSSSAHRATIGNALDQVKHAVGDGKSTSGDIATPASGAQARAVIGS